MVDGTQRHNGAAAEQLCLACGLCCNGVIFADVKLQAGDNPSALRACGLPLKPDRSTRHGKGLCFDQPCAAFDGVYCRIYASRPTYCRAFECLELKRLKAGKSTLAAGLTLIRRARRRVEVVLRLLRELGDTEEHVPLAKRVRRTAKRLQTLGVGGADAAVFSRLTLAAHEVNVLLQDSFYPGAGEAGG
jgi:uncharacterized protein